MFSKKNLEINIVMGSPARGKFYEDYNDNLPSYCFLSHWIRMIIRAINTF